MKAFPTNIKVATGGDGWRTNYGMDLRDYFAAKVMQSLVNHEEVYPEDEICSYAYKIADQMMKTRAL
jgi:hypothetical protein